MIRFTFSETAKTTRFLDKNHELRKTENIRLQGWNKRETTSPKSFMMASKFSPVFVGVEGDRRFLFAPLDKVQIAYLRALEVHPAVFTKMGSSTGSIRSGYQ